MDEKKEERGEERVEERRERGILLRRFTSLRSLDPPFCTSPQNQDIRKIWCQIKRSQCCHIFFLLFRLLLLILSIIYRETQDTC